MKQFYTLIFLLLVLSYSAQRAHGQVEVVWDKTYGGNKSDELAKIVATRDGGYLLCGTSASPISGDRTVEMNGIIEDFWIVKINSYGSIAWQKAISHEKLYRNQKLYDAIQTSDGNYLLGGYSDIQDQSGKSSSSGRDYWLIKMTENGAILWQTSLRSRWGDYGGGGQSYLTSLAESNGIYLAAGYTDGDKGFQKSEDSKGGNDFWLVGVSSSGIQLWDRTYGGDANDFAHAAVATNDGAFLVGGQSKSGISGDKTTELVGTDDGWLIKVNASNGGLLWEKSIRSSHTDFIKSICSNGNGKYLIGMYMWGGSGYDRPEGGGAIWVIEIDNQGNFLMNKVYGGRSGVDQFSHCISIGTSGYLLASTSSSVAGGDKSETGLGGDYWAIRIDENGNKLWDKTLVGDQFDYSPVVTHIPNTNSFLVGGTSNSNSGRGDKSEDSRGGYDYWVVKLEVKDETPPQITDMPADITFDITSGNHCLAKVNWAPPTVTDDLSSLTLTSSHAPDSYFPLGTTTVTYTATDAANNSSSASFTVTVVDKQPPAPDLAELPDIIGDCSAKVPVLPTAADHCNGVIFGETTDPMEYTEPGNYTITWKFEDRSGNSVTQAQKVVIVDDKPPVPDVEQLPALYGDCRLTVTAVPTATDDCVGKVNATTKSELTFSSTGEYSIQWEYSDAAGNKESQQQAVIVQDKKAPQPVVAQLPDLVADCQLKIPTIPQAEDNCQGTIAATTNDPLEYNASGTYTIRWHYKDEAGNITTQQQKVSIRDEEAPVPDMGTLSELIAQCELTIEEAAFPTASDNCQGSIKATTADPLRYQKQGSYTITWKYTDAAGNSSTQTQKVTIKDTEAPQLAETNLPTLKEACELKITTIPTATDSCFGTVQATTKDPLEYKEKGIYTIHWTFDDGHGNILNKEQQVEISDTEAPVITSLDNIAVSAPDGACEAMVNFPTPEASDNCTIVSFERNDESGLESGDAFPVGTTTISYMATDAAGNTTTKSFHVTVTIPPIAISIEEFIFEPIASGTNVSLRASFSGNSFQKAVWQWGDGNSSIASVSGDQITGSHTYASAGVYPVSLLITENCRQETIHPFFSINVYDGSQSSYITISGWFYLNADAFSSRREDEKAFLIFNHYPEKNTSAMILKTAEHTFESQESQITEVNEGLITLEGKGLLDGTEDYSYRLSVIDEDKSEAYTEGRLRLQLFHPSGKLFMDTQVGDEEDAEMGTALEEGDMLFNGSLVLGFDDLVSVGFNVYPLPFQDKLYLELPSSKGPLQLMIHSLDGKALASERILHPQSEILYQLQQDFSTWHKGIYILTVSTTEETYRMKLMKK